MGWSGKNGEVLYGAAVHAVDGTYTAGTATTTLLEVTNWNADGKFRVHTYGCSGSAGYQITCVGTGSVTGDIEVKLQSSLTLNPGKCYSMILRNAAVTLTGRGTIEGAPVSTRIDGGDPVSATYRFQSDGAWMFAAGTGTDGNS